MWHFSNPEDGDPGAYALGLGEAPYPGSPARGEGLSKKYCQTSRIVVKLLIITNLHQANGPLGGCQKTAKNESELETMVNQIVRRTVNGLREQARTLRISEMR